MPDARAEIFGPSLDDVPILKDSGPLTLSAFLLEVCRRHPGRDALVFDDPLQGYETVRWTYSDLECEARRVARALLAAGLGKSARVATLMANRPEAVAAYFGAALAGAVVVPLSTFSTKHELHQLLAHSDASVLLTQSAMGSHNFAVDIAELIDRPLNYPYLRHVAVVGPEQDTHGLMSWREFIDSGETVAPELVDAVVAATSPSDLGLIIYSSGTTAAPKGMLHHHRAPTLQFWLQADLFGRTPDTRMWTALPLFWTAGMNTAMGATFASGGCWIMQEGFDAAMALRLIEREHVTEPYTLPHQAKALEEHADWAATDLSSLTSVFGKSVFARHHTVTGDPGWQMPVGWGMSETCAFICAHRSDTDRTTMRSSLGRLLAGNRLRVVDSNTGELLSTGEDGELIIQGLTLMEHYVGKSREECFDPNGWFHTGDVGHVDADGQVHWTGRRTEMIKTGGANVSPAEIEVQLRAHPDVRLARVIGIPDERLEQVAVLCVELVAETAQDAEGLRTFLRGRLASYKVPKLVHFFAAGDIPMTASGTKVADDALLRLVLARMSKPQ